MSDRPALPLKLYYRIGEVANVVGVETHVLRYWESEFTTIRPQKSAKGHRVYSRRDVEKLIAVKQLLYSEGYTVQGAKRKLQELGRGRGALANVASTATAKGEASPLPELEADGPSKSGDEREPEALSMGRESPESLGSSLGPLATGLRHGEISSPRAKETAFQYRRALEALRSSLIDELSTLRTRQH